MARRSRDEQRKKPPAAKRRRVALEALEPRVLLSADPTLLGALDSNDDDRSQLPEETSERQNSYIRKTLLRVDENLDSALAFTGVGE